MDQLEQVWGKTLTGAVKQEVFTPVRVTRKLGVETTAYSDRLLKWYQDFADLAQEFWGNMASGPDQKLLLMQGYVILQNVTGPEGTRLDVVFTPDSDGRISVDGSVSRNGAVLTRLRKTFMDNETLEKPVFWVDSQALTAARRS
jgi:hypothetical protein